MDVVVAPHFDDAAFSAVGILVARRPAVVVLTVCAGSPLPGELEEWDVECGFTSGAEAVAVRAREDARANALAGVQSIHLELTDAPYRKGFPHERVMAELACRLPAEGRVWVPAGLGSHPDHVGTREAVLALLAADRNRVAFYADCPYAFAFGWNATEAERDAEHRWEPALSRIGRYLGPIANHRLRLDDDAMRLKLAMVRAHESQVKVMASEFPGLLDPGGPMRTESYWTTAPELE